MIVNICALADDNQTLVFNIPRLNFDRRFNYKIGMCHVNFDVAAGTSVTDNELLCINTNVVDLSVQNPIQTILHFPYNGKRTMQNIKPSLVTHHSLQLYEFENASFKLERVFTNNPINLKHIFLQLEILRVDAYGRFQ